MVTSCSFRFLEGSPFSSPQLQNPEGNGKGCSLLKFYKTDGFGFGFGELIYLFCSCQSISSVPTRTASKPIGTTRASVGRTSMATWIDWQPATTEKVAKKKLHNAIAKLHLDTFRYKLVRVQIWKFSYLHTHVHGLGLFHAARALRTCRCQDMPFGNPSYTHIGFDLAVRNATVVCFRSWDYAIE